MDCLDVQKVRVNSKLSNHSCRYFSQARIACYNDAMAAIDHVERAIGTWIQRYGIDAVIRMVHIGVASDVSVRAVLTNGVGFVPCMKRFCIRSLSQRWLHLL